MKYAHLTSLNAIDPLPNLGALVVKQNPVVEDARKREIEDFERKCFDPQIGIKIKPIALKIRPAAEVEWGDVMTSFYSAAGEFGKKIAQEVLRRISPHSPIVSCPELWPEAIAALKALQ